MKQSPFLFPIYLATVVCLAFSGALAAIAAPAAAATHGAGTDARCDLGRALTVKPANDPAAAPIELYKASYALVVGNGAYSAGGWDANSGNSVIRGRSLQFRRSCFDGDQPQQGRITKRGSHYTSYGLVSP